MSSHSVKEGQTPYKKCKQNIINKICEIIVLMYAVLLRLYLKDCIQSGTFHFKKNLGTLKKSPRNQQ